MVLGCGSGEPEGHVASTPAPAGTWCLGGQRALVEHAPSRGLELAALERGGPPSPAPADTSASLCLSVEPDRALQLDLESQPPGPGLAALVGGLEPQELHCRGTARVASGALVVERPSCCRYPGCLDRPGDTHCLFDVERIVVGIDPDGSAHVEPFEASYQGGCSAWATRAIRVGGAQLRRVP